MNKAELFAAIKAKHPGTFRAKDLIKLPALLEYIDHFDRDISAIIAGRALQKLRGVVAGELRLDAVRNEAIRTWEYRVTDVRERASPLLPTPEPVAPFVKVDGTRGQGPARTAELKQAAREFVANRVPPAQSVTIDSDGHRHVETHYQRTDSDGTRHVETVKHSPNPLNPHSITTIYEDGPVQLRGAFVGHHTGRPNADGSWPGGFRAGMNAMEETARLAGAANHYSLPTLHQLRCQILNVPEDTFC